MKDLCLTLINYAHKLDRLLDRMGGLYLASDLIKTVNEGRMQVHVENDSVAITQISLYPRARVLDVIGAVGNLGDLRKVHNKVLQYAHFVDAGVVRTYGRSGWLPDAKERGWRIKARNYVYQKDM